MPAELCFQLSLDDELNRWRTKRETDKLTYGCFLRSTESLLKARATEEQWDQRLGYIVQVGLSPDLLFRTRTLTAQEEDYHRQIWLADVEWMKIFLNNLPKTDTPLGQSMNNYQFKQVEVKPRSIRRRLRKGKEVLIITEGHMAHIQYSGGMWFTCLSDYGVGMRYSDDQLYTIFEFTKKD